MIAADVMTRNVISVPPDALVSDAVQLMLDNRISGLFVIDAQGVLQGVITEGDLLHREETGTGRRSSWWLRLFVPGREASDFTHNHSRRIADLMTTDVVSVEEGAELSDVVQTMERNHVKRVPVMKDGRVTGVISRANLLRALSAVAREAPRASTDDRSIQAAIIAALDKVTWAPVARMDLTVLDGVVEIWGTVTSEDERRAVCVIAENTPGVKKVIDHMVFMDPYSGLIVEPGPEPTPRV
jgi:CBS domain-containing protein